jgi:hypothetical protein
MSKKSAMDMSIPLDTETLDRAVSDKTIELDLTYTEALSVICVISCGLSHFENDERVQESRRGLSSETISHILAAAYKVGEELIGKTHIAQRDLSGGFSG